MKIAVLGLGHVGSVAAGCLADQGHRVLGIDPNPEKVRAINEGRSPVVEPHLDDMICSARVNGRLHAATEIGDRLVDCELALVCVGTPSAGRGAHDLQHIVSATRSLARAISPQRNSKLTIAYRSTVRPGTCEEVIAPIFRHHLGEPANDRVEIVHHPEFLREGSAVEDFRNPPRVVIGTADGQPNTHLQALYRGYTGQVFHVSLREAEMIKLVDNTWHAAKVSFANEIGRICQSLRVSAKAIHEVFIADEQLNLGDTYLKPGAPFGGSCLPKDVRALSRIAASSAVPTPLIDSLLPSNEAHKQLQFEQASDGLEPGARILILGLAFKDETDDLRESPQVDLARRLLAAGYRVDIHDPAIVPERMVGQNREYALQRLPDLASMLVDRDTDVTHRYARILSFRDGLHVSDFNSEQLLTLCTTP